MESQTNLVLLITLSCMVMFFFVMIIVVFVVVYQRKMLQKQNQITVLEQTRQISEFKAVVEAQENEKEKIAANLHDEIGPMLTVLKLHISKHDSDLKKGRVINNGFKGEIELIDTIVQNLRSTCHDLTPNFLLEFGLVKALQQFTEAIGKAEDLTTNFRISDPDQELELPKQDTINLYRICVELLNNLLKHAGCRNLAIDIDFSPGLFSVQLSHDGNGLSQEEFEDLSAKSNGLGLKSLKSRVLIMNAQLSFLKNDHESIVAILVPH